MPGLIEPGVPTRPDDATVQTDFRLAHADDTFHMLDTVEESSGATLPTDITLTLAQTVDPDELRKASVLIARKLDFSPTFLLRQSTGREMLNAPVTEFKDPITGGPVSLATARRLLKPVAVPVMRSMLRHVFNTPTPEQFDAVLQGDIPKLRRIDSGLPPTPARVSSAVGALAPLEGDAFPWSEALGAAIQIARTDVDLALFQANLTITQSIPGASPVQAIAMAHLAAAKGVRFNDRTDALKFAYPAAGTPLEKAGQLLQEKTQYDAARSAVLADPFAAGLGYLPPEAEPMSEQTGSTRLAAGLLAGDVSQTAGDYLRMAKLVAQRAKLEERDFHSTFGYKALHAIGEGLNTAYNYTAGMFWRGRAQAAASQNLALPTITGGYRPVVAELERQIDVSRAIQEGKETIGQAFVSDFHLPKWTTPIVDLAFAFELDPTIIAGKLISITRASKVLMEIPGAIPKGMRAEEGAGSIRDLLNKPLRALRFSHVGSGKTVPEYLVDEALRANDSHKFFLSAVDRFRGHWATEGIDRTFAAQVFDYSRAASGSGHTRAEIVDTVKEMLSVAFGANPAGLGARLSEERQAVDRVLRERAMQDLYSRYGQVSPQIAKQIADEGLELSATKDEAWLLAILDDAEVSLLTGPRLMHEIPHFRPSTDVMRGIARTRLADSGVGRSISATFNKTPRALFDLEGLSGPGFDEQINTYLRRARTHTQQEIAQARLNAARVIDPSHPERSAAFQSIIRKAQDEVIERKALAAGFDKVTAEQFVHEARMLADDTNTLLAQSRLYGVMSSEDEALGVVTSEQARKPVFTTQLLNKAAAVDPILVEKILRGNFFSIRRLENAMRRLFGHPTRPIITADGIPRTIHEALGLDRLLSGWKRLAVTRPAYVTRVVLLDENLRYSATLGLFSHIEATKSGARVVSVLDRLTGKLPTTVSYETPEGLKTIEFKRPGLEAEDPSVAVGVKDRAILESMGEEERRLASNLRATGGFRAITKDAPNYFTSWARNLNDQLGRAPEAGPILEAIAEGRPAMDGAAAAARFLRDDPLGRRFAAQLAITDPEEWSRLAARVIDEYTGGDQVVARAALTHTVDGDILKALPEDRWPYEVHGAELERIGQAKQSIWHQALDWYSKAILERPTNALSRHPYFKAWNQAAKRAMLDQALVEGRVVTDEEQMASMLVRERELAASIAAETADPFAEMRDQAGIVFHGSKAPITSAEDLAPLQFGDPAALVGPGAYFTDDPEIASGYARTRGRGAAGKVFAARLNPDLKYVNLDWQLAPPVKDIFERVLHSLPEGEGVSLQGKTGMEAMQRLKEAIGDSGYTTIDAHEVFLSLQGDLEQELGINGFLHRGGIRGGPPHRVTVLFDTGYEAKPMVGKVEGLQALTPGDPKKVAAAMSELDAMRARLKYAVPMSRIENEAGDFARSQVRRIMFDMRDQGRLGEMLRFVVPFFQPWAEAFTVWGRILHDNPAIVGYAYQAIHQGIESGFLHRDPDTGQLVVPMSNWLAAGPMLHAMFGGHWHLSAPLSGFNLFFNSTIPLPTGSLAGSVPLPFPGFSPPAQMVVQKLSEWDALPMGVRLSLASWAFQYGPTTVGSVVPRWLKYAAMYVLGGNVDNAQFKSTADDFLRLQQLLGVHARTDEPPPNLDAGAWKTMGTEERLAAWDKWLADQANHQAREFFGARSFISAFFPAAPKIDFPFVQYRREYDDLTTKLGFEKGREEFLRQHPDLSLVTIPNTMWNRDLGHSIVPIPATKQVAQIMGLPGFKEFAKRHPQWVWAIIPSEARNGQFDLNTYFSQIATGLRDTLSPEDVLSEGDRQAGWDAYFAARTQHEATLDGLDNKGIGPGDPPYEQERARWSAWVEDAKRVHPQWGDSYNSFSTRGVDPQSLAWARKLATDPIFSKTETGSWLKGYLALTRGVFGEMEAHNIHSLQSKAARDLGITHTYQSGVKALNTQYPDGKLAYEAFFSDALQVKVTAGDRALLGLDPTQSAQVTEQWARWQSALDAPVHADPGPDKLQTFLDIRTMADSAFTGPGPNWLRLWWGSKDDLEKTAYLQNLLGRPYEFLSRFDRQIVLGEKTSDSSEQLWLNLAQDQLAIAKARAENPLAPAAPMYEALDALVNKWAAGDPVFADQIAHANEWGWAIREVIPTVAKGSDSMPYWNAFLDDLRNVQVAVDTPIATDSAGNPIYLHGPDVDVDPKKKAVWVLFKKALTDERDRLFGQSPQFRREWDRLEQLNGYDSLIDYLVPNTWFPLGGPARAPGGAA